MLVVQTRMKGFKRQRDKFTAEAKIDVLSILLANTMGMAPTYWVLTAREIVSTEKAGQ